MFFLILFLLLAPTPVSAQEQCDPPSVHRYSDLLCCFERRGGPQGCLDENLPELAKDLPTEDLLDRLMEEGKYDEGVARRCHFFAHAIGRYRGERMSSFNDALRSCDARCQSGCMHGVVERMFFNGISNEKHFSLTDLEERIPDVCTRDALGDGRAVHVECTHGLGHAIMSTLGYDLDAALDGCSLVRDREGQLSCQLGVFMENIITDQVDRRDLKSDDPLYPCSRLAEEYQSMCWTEQPKALLGRGMSPSEVSEVCLGLSTPGLTDRCFEGLGRDTTGPARAGDMPKAIAACSALSGAPRDACLRGAVMAIIDVSQDASLALQYCDAHENDARTTCINIVVWYLHSVHELSRNTLLMQCDLGSESVHDACVQESLRLTSFWKKLLRWLF